MIVSIDTKSGFYKTPNACSYKNTQQTRNRNQDLNKPQDVPCSRLGRLNTVKVSILSILIYRFNAFPIKTIS